MVTSVLGLADQMKSRVFFSHSFHDGDHPWGVDEFRDIAVRSMVKAELTLKNDIDEHVEFV